MRAAIFATFSQKKKFKSLFDELLFANNGSIGWMETFNRFNKRSKCIFCATNRLTIYSLHNLHLIILLNISIKKNYITKHIHTYVYMYIYYFAIS